MNYPILFIENATEVEYALLAKGINQFANSLGLSAAAGSYFFAAYDDSSRMIAALSGFDNFGVCEIGGLWVDERYRGQGYGKALIQKAEEWAKSKGLTLISVFTLKEWPAFSWYKALGFKVEFERQGHANQMIGAYLTKNIASLS